MFVSGMVGAFTWPILIFVGIGLASVVLALASVRAARALWQSRGAHEAQAALRARILLVVIPLLLGAWLAIGGIATVLRAPQWLSAW